MKKILSISILLFLFSCEDDKADETAAVNLDGTYKLSMESADCGDGEFDVQYLTIDNLMVSNWDYDGDDCDQGDDCYDAESFSVKKDGDGLSFSEGPDVKVSMTRNGTNGLKVSFSMGGSVVSSEIWDYESSEIKTYSPICN